MPEEKTLNKDLFYKGSSANLRRLHTCENKVPFWDFKEFAVTVTSDARSEPHVQRILSGRKCIINTQKISADRDF